MGIINGTFDTDLSGWEKVNNVGWENGKAHLTNNLPVCNPSIKQRFLITNTTISFDNQLNRRSIGGWCYYQGSPNQGSVTFKWSLVAHIPTIDPLTGNTIITNVTVYDETLPSPYCQQNTCGALPENTIVRDVSQYIGNEATLTFEYFTTAYSSCGCALADMWIDNVINSPNWGTLRVSSAPAGANIYVDGSFLNLTPETGSIDLTNISPGNHTVKITKTDYYDFTTTVNVLPGRIYDISATLNPQVGCLSFLSDPVGAKIFLSDRNGQVLNDTGFTTFKQICNLLWGDYKWKLLLDGYYPQEGTVTLNTSAGAVITKTLTQIGIGCIYFTSSPAGAKIFVDNVDTGKVTPDTICGLSLGSHHYELVLTGYLPASGDITLVSTHGGSVSLDLIACIPNWQCEQPRNGYESDGCGNRRLNSACNPCTPLWQCESGQTGYEIDGCGNRRANPACLAKGSIKFTSTPAGAEIFIDGSDQGKVTPHTITDVPVGSHGYTLKLDGFKDYTGTVPVLENQIAEVSVSLIPLESCIYFVTSIPGAKIFVDNVDTGQVTPALICGLSLGSHTYRLELAGYKTVTGSVGIGAGQGVVVASVLTPVEKGIGAGTILGIVTVAGLIGVGIVIMSKEKEQPPIRTRLKS